MPALAVWTAYDGLLSAVAPLGLAAAAGTALVVDLDPAGPVYPGSGSLADLVADGPRRVDLVPGRNGVAVLRNGGVAKAEAREVIDALLIGWPHLVVRVGAPDIADGLAPLVPVWPLLPGMLAPTVEMQCVYQRTGFVATPPGPGPVLPRPRPAFLAGLLNGTVARHSRWVAAWREVWRLPWH
ncbi:MAG: hypothetical protein OEM81_10400 [Acidimicrobiia bacterium]|nr:hypothetical protein [Acidimicrobiia bacterium]MDH3398227.1 hypothetical protein [Acidimicrobiia bacterium]MDH5614927.1 hypothetical protein [Acidimicrobiia bacterium]